MSLYVPISFINYYVIWVLDYYCDHFEGDNIKGCGGLNLVPILFINYYFIRLLGDNLDDGQKNKWKEG